MTSLQVDYWKLEETKRTNLANENLRGKELEETIRHNQQSEAIGWAQVGEQSRHNKETERIQGYSAITNRMHEFNWKKVQDDQIALQRDANEVAKERNRISALDNALGFERLEWEKTKWTPEYEMQIRSLDQREEEIAVKESDNRRKWVESIFGMGRQILNDSSGSSNDGKRSTWTTIVDLLS